MKQIDLTSRKIGGYYLTYVNNSGYVSANLYRYESFSSKHIATWACKTTKYYGSFKNIIHFELSEDEIFLHIDLQEFSENI